MSFVFDWFQVGADPANVVHGSYDTVLVTLSYIVAFFASYIAFDFAGRLRVESSKLAKSFWLLGGAFAMGAGVWSMHFIGMLAFVLPMPMSYGLFWTLGSMIVAIVASGFSLFLFQRARRPFKYQIIWGGVLLGLGIVAMHYMGMQAMKHHIRIHYIPSLFFLSILVAVLASEAALWLVLKSYTGSFRRQLQIKIFSAVIMGAAICGMHYIGIAAAVFSRLPLAQLGADHMVNIATKNLAFYIAGITGIIMTIALAVSTYKQFVVSSTRSALEALRQTQYQLIEYERMATVGRLAAGVAHEINNPLSFVMSNVGMLQREYEKILKVLGDYQDFIQDIYLSDTIKLKKKQQMIKEGMSSSQKANSMVNEILSECSTGLDRIKHIVNELSAFSQVETYEEEVDINECIEAAVKIAWNELKYKSVLHKNLLPVPKILGHSNRLKNIFIHLLINAIDAIPEKGEIWVSSECVDNEIKVIVKDDGVGIAEEDLPKLFIPFFTTKFGVAKGLGLSSVYQAVKNHGGSIKVISQLNEGSAFIIKFPVHK